jgi:hypothetical protein
MLNEKNVKLLVNISEAEKNLIKELKKIEQKAATGNRAEL